MHKYKSTCKNCEHHSHKGFCQVIGLDYALDDSVNEPTYCNCKEYIPSANLEYLEWRYNKRSRKK